MIYESVATERENQGADDWIKILKREDICNRSGLRFSNGKISETDLNQVQIINGKILNGKFHLTGGFLNGYKKGKP